ncbi:MAG: non-ribosomal peptide synthetase [Verrucomicrobiales bacterium]|nr:non-ribosomal peptide synthetase [Verrucomicrobiales bacterium]
MATSVQTDRLKVGKTARIAAAKNPGSDREFWKTKLSYFSAPTSFNLVRPVKAPREDHHYVTRYSSTDAQFQSLLLQFTSKANVCPETVYLGAWALLLGAYSTEERVVFGTRFEGIPASDLFWPLILDVKSSLSVSAWLMELDVELSSYQSQDAASAKDLRQWCEIPNNQPIIESLVEFGPNGDRGFVAGNPQGIKVTVNGASGGLNLEFSGSALDKAAVEALLQQYAWVLRQMVEHPEKNLKDLDMVPPAQRTQILGLFNKTNTNYPPVKNLKTLFEAQVEKTPSTIAVCAPLGNSPLKSLTYYELNERANQLAHFLQKSGVREDVVVGVCLERSVELAIAVLAIIKAGGAYVPFDPSYPKDRLTFMLEDTCAPLLLTQESLIEEIPATETRLLCLDRDAAQFADAPNTNPVCRTSEDHLAYLIYTSGSTGKPKGVAMRQGPLVNLLFWQFDNWGYTLPARTLQFSSLNFDVSFQEIFSTTCSGGTLVMIPENNRRDSNLLIHFIAEQSIQRIFLPFVALKHLAEAAERNSIYPNQLAEVITAGEQLQVTPQIVQFFTKLKECTLHNQYGPSETHVVTAHDLKGSALYWPPLPSIGKPIANAKIYILNEQKDFVPIGMPGELFIGGDCLARGYLNRQDLTDERFIPDPFSSKPGAKMYKAGDLARFLPNGNLEFLGRIDHQVKIRGYRVELGEIEAVLSKHPAVRESVVVARVVTGGEKQLAAYIVTQNGKTYTIPELRDYLKTKLPVYCVPAAFVKLEKLPLTPNGKVDRKALPEPKPVVEEHDQSIKLPQTPLEMQIQLVFERFLNRRPIGTDISFFELGGDSLQAMKLIVEIERVSGKKLPMGILYQASTIEAISRKIEEVSRPEEWSSLVPLQTLGTKKPLFLIHTTPGDVLGYGNLVYHLGTEQPCYGLQSLGFKDSSLAHTNVPEMARYYIQQIQTVQPHGPYFLGGWCYGGILAVEMAQQLARMGEKTALLALIETPAPSPGYSNIRYALRRFQCLFSMSPLQWKRYVVAKVNYYRGVRLADEMRFKRASLEEIEDPVKVAERNKFLDNLEHIYHTNLNALDGYESHKYAGKIILFNAAIQDPAVIPDPNYGWKSLVKQIERHIVPGDHDTILMEPNVKLLAKQLERCLEEAGK